MRGWFRLGASGWALWVMTAAYAFAIFWDSRVLKISLLDIQLAWYGGVLVVAALAMLGPAKWKWIGFCLGGITWTTFVLGIIPHLSYSKRADVETDVAFLTLYGVIAAFYWIEMYRRLYVAYAGTDAEMEVGGYGMRDGAVGSEAE